MATWSATQEDPCIVPSFLPQSISLSLSLTLSPLLLRLKPNSFFCVTGHGLIWIAGAENLPERLVNEPDLKERLCQYLDHVVQHWIPGADATTTAPRTPQLPHDILNYCADCYPELHAAMQKYIDSLDEKEVEKHASLAAYLESLKETGQSLRAYPESDEEEDDSVRQQYVDVRTASSEPPNAWTPGPSYRHERKAWLADVSKLALKAQMHVHLRTCFKCKRRYDPMYTICRFGYNGKIGQKLHAKTHWSGDTLHPARPADPAHLNRFLNGFNLYIQAALRANHDVQFLQSISDSWAVVQYVASYISKATSFPLFLVLVFVWVCLCRILNSLYSLVLRRET